MNTTTAGTGSMSDDELSRARTIAEITNLNAETRKYVEGSTNLNAETRKYVEESTNLNAETRKFIEESMKFGTERKAHGWIVGAAILGAGVSATLLLLRLFGLI